MVEVAEIVTTATADTQEFHRKMDKVDRQIDETQEKADRASESDQSGVGGGLAGGFIGGAVGGAVGGAISQTPLGRLGGNLLSATLAPIILRMVPVLRSLTKFLQSDAFQKMVDIAAKAIGGTAETAEQAVSFLEGPPPGEDRSEAGRLLDIGLGIGSIPPATLASAFALSRGEQDIAQRAFDFPADRLERGFVGDPESKRRESLEKWFREATTGFAYDPENQLQSGALQNATSTGIHETGGGHG